MLSCHKSLSLEDLLSDDLVQTMMRADRVDPASLRVLIRTVTRQRMTLPNPSGTVRGRLSRAWHLLEAKAGLSH